MRRFRALEPSGVLPPNVYLDDRLESAGDVATRITIQKVTEWGITLSVIIPVYNRLHLLGNVVESILAQTVPVTEVILIDDGSTEHTPEMVERYIQERPAWRERVRYHYQQNQGQSAANNVGIAMAKGEWLGFDGSDDLWLPQKLEWQFKALEKYPVKPAFALQTHGS